ncbi:MAG: PIN domain-containing protein [Deltaproteobacteria bacterium]|nr:PIN domain-containing protein [Deltaproteobacteria bacterium]
MRVAIDTNVFVSSFFGGVPKQVLDRWKVGALTLCRSRPIVEDYTAVLERLGVDAPELRDPLKLFAERYHCVFTTSAPELRLIDADPDDDKFIACAVALGATAVVSGDKHLLSVGDYMGIQMLTPRQFLDLRTV